MFRKTLEHYLGKLTLLRAVSNRNRINRIVVHVSESKEKPDYRIADLGRENFSVKALDAMFSAINTLNTEKYPNKINYRIITYPGVWIEDKIDLGIETSHDNLTEVYSSVKTLIEGLKKYKQNIK